MVRFARHQVRGYAVAPYAISHLWENESVGTLYEWGCEDAYRVRYVRHWTMCVIINSIIWIITHWMLRFVVWVYWQVTSYTFSYFDGVIGLEISSEPHSKLSKLCYYKFDTTFWYLTRIHINTSICNKGTYHRSSVWFRNSISICERIRLFRIKNHLESNSWSIHGYRSHNIISDY